MINSYKILVGKHKGKASLGSLRYTWKNNIKMDLEDIGELNSSGS
jgi:hypothetical protein